MGKITDALKKAADERMERMERITRIKQEERLIVKKIGESNVDARIVTYFDPKGLITEQYKILRTNILSLKSVKRPKSIVITSAIHSEGKTITSLNLAVSMSQAVRKPKILLIDADMRRGRIAKYLGVNQEVGLSELLQGKATPSEVMFNIDIDNLTFISSGETPDNPAELLGSDTMSKLLSDMRQKFDYLLIDTPPIIPVTDSGIVGAQCDGVVIVIQAGRTQRGVVRRAEELLYQAHSKILGHVLTNIEYHLPEYIYRYL